MRTPRPRPRSPHLQIGCFTDYEMATVSLAHYRRLVRMHDRVELALEIRRGPAGNYELRVDCGESAVVTERARYRRLTGFDPCES